MKRHPLTQRGAERLREELKRLKFVERPNLSKAIATAREHGDLKENAEYHAAKEQQSFVEGRIQEIETKLANAEIIDVTRLDAGGKVVFGSTVTIADAESGAEVQYQLVGEDEADIKAGLISVTSPIARALIGKRAGDEIQVEAPGGRRSYEVVQVRYV
jgi:transcription elongation factor GreA